MSAYVKGQADSMAWQPALGFWDQRSGPDEIRALAGVSSLTAQLSGKALCPACQDVLMWRLAPEQTEPNVLLVMSAVSKSLYGVVCPPRSVEMHPGANREYALLIWTAPLAGIARITARFSRVDSATTDVHVLAAGKPLYTASVVDDAVEVRFSLSVQVSVGDTIEFAVGDGGDGYGADTTRLEASISLVASP